MKKQNIVTVRTGYRKNSINGQHLNNCNIRVSFTGSFITKEIKSKTFLISLAILTMMLFQTSVLLSQENEISIPVKQIALKIEKHKIYEWAPCPEGVNSEQIENYRNLSKVATNKELILLLNDKSAAVSAYSLTELVKRKYDSLYQITLNHLNDFRKLEVHYYGCEFVHGSNFETTIADFFIEKAHTYFNEKDRLELDSLMLFSDKKYQLLEYSLDDKNFDKKYHERIKQLVATNKYKFAPIALARYQDTMDLELLEQKLFKDPYYSIPLIEIFPHEYFKYFISEYGKNENKLDFIFYKSVAVFRDTFALTFLTSEFERAKDDFYTRESDRFLYEAISKYRSSIYNELYFKLWERGFLINDTLFTYLVNINKEKSISLAGASLRSLDKLKVHSLVINEMLYYLVENDRELAREIIIEQLSNNEYLYFYPEFAENAKYFKEQEVIDVLFSRLKTSDNPYIYYPIVETILFYKENNLNLKMIETIKDNNKIDGWGLEKVSAKLQEYNLKIE